MSAARLRSNAERGGLHELAQRAGAAARLEHPAVAKVSLSHAPGDPVVEVAVKHQGEPKQSITIVIITIITITTTITTAITITITTTTATATTITISSRSSSSDSSRTHTVQVKFAFGKCNQPTRP